jgi:hypothetical protein
MENIEAATQAGSTAVFAWNRRRELKRIGFRLYSSADWVRHFKAAGQPSIIPSDDPLHDHREPLPEKFYVLDLDAEPGNEALRSLTYRLARYERLIDYFSDVSTGRFVPTIYAPFIRKPHLPPSIGPAADWHGPSAERQELAKAIWATMPKNDSDIFERKAEPSENPKLDHLADRLKPLLAWRHARVSVSLDSTNWLQADNDNHFDGERASPKAATNLERRIRPGSSDAELKSFIKKAGPCREWTHAKLGGGGEIEHTPTDVDFVRVVDKRNKFGEPTQTHMAMVRAGKLRLATGKTESYGERVEEGTILYQPDKFGELLGPEPDDDEKARSLSYWTSLMRYDADTASSTLMEPVRFKRAGRIRRKAKFKLSKAEMQEVLATQPHPPVTHYKPGLPCGAEDIGSQFVGGWISATKGNQPPDRWQDVSDELSRQAEFDRWFAALPEDQRKALDLACTAANFREIGEAFGKEGKTAERYGKRVLIAANDTLEKVMAA